MRRGPGKLFLVYQNKNRIGSSDRVPERKTPVSPLPSFSGLPMT
jgi:hypothetical protein